MLELTIYGLVGLAAMLIMAFCFAYADEVSSARKQFSFDPNDNAHLTNSPAIKPGTSSPAFNGGQAEAFRG
jgi:hypothetical protein